MDTYRNFIDGNWVESASSRTVTNVNPANTADVIGTVKINSTRRVWIIRPALHSD